MKKHGRFWNRFIILPLVCATGYTFIKACALPLTPASTSGTTSSVVSADPESAHFLSVNVRDFGATGDGQTSDTCAIQAAINYVTENGGGEVYLPTGNYSTTTLRLKTNVSLNISSEAVLLASQNQSDWTSSDQMPVILAWGQKSISIYGSGTIDGGGLYYYTSGGDFVSGCRPSSIIGCFGCQNVNISGIKLQNSTRFTVQLDKSDNVVCNGIIIRNRESSLNRETDGIDINSCRHVVVKNVDIITGDDAICVGTDGQNECYEILVQNCTVATNCSATKIGTVTNSNIYNVRFSNITVNRFPSSSESCLSAINLQSNDGAAVHDITCENYTINDCDTPIFLVLQNRQTFVEHTSDSQLYNITLNNITCLHSTRASQINTEGNLTICNVVFDNVQTYNHEKYWVPANTPYYDYTFSDSVSIINAIGLSGKAVTGNIMYRPKCPDGSDPDPSAYLRMPAYGLFAKNVMGLIIKDNVIFYDNGYSGRPMIVYENVNS